jgi:hypothetical protein
MCKNIPVDVNTLNTLPTNGVELETITYKKHKYIIREIGGNFLPVWAKYYESSQMVIFMVDMSNYAQVPITCVEFLNLLCHKALYKKNFLLLLNKIDQPYAMTRSILEHIMFLDAAKKEAYAKFGQTIWVEEISAAKGLGLDKVLFWMQDTKRSASHLSPKASPKIPSPPKQCPKGGPKGPSYSPRDAANSPKGMHLQPSLFFPNYALSTIYEHGLKMPSPAINNNNNNNNSPSSSPSSSPPNNPSTTNRVTLNIIPPATSTITNSNTNSTTHINPTTINSTISTNLTNSKADTTTNRKSPTNTQTTPPTKLQDDSPSPNPLIPNPNSSNIDNIIAICDPKSPKSSPPSSFTNPNSHPNSTHSHPNSDVTSNKLHKLTNIENNSIPNFYLKSSLNPTPSSPDIAE